MPWTAPRTWAVGELVTAAIMNISIRDNQIFLKDSQSIYVPVNYSKLGGVIEPIETYSSNYPAARLRDANDEGGISFRVPAGFTTIVLAKLLVFPRATDGAANWDIFSSYCAEGEAASTHQENDVATTYNVVNTQLFGLDVSGILTALVALDLVGIRLLLADAADDCDLVGFYMTWT